MAKNDREPTVAEVLAERAKAAAKAARKRAAVAQDRDEDEAASWQRAAIEWEV